MVQLLKRAGLAWLALQMCWQGAAAQETSPERSTPPPPPPAAPAPEVAKPIVPGPQAPIDPLNSVRPVPADGARAPAVLPLQVPPPLPATAPAPPTLTPSPSPTLTLTPSPTPPLPAPGKSAVGIDPNGQALGHDLDAVRRSPPAAGTALRALKRLSPPEILASTSDALSMYVLRESERTIVLDFPNTREQSKMFARLILFIERGGASKTRVMTVPEVQKWLKENAQQFDTMTVGNNMRTGEIARFFNSARFQGEPVTVDEQKLYDWLVQSQLLREEDAGVSVVEPERILVSVPQPSSVPGCGGCTVTAAQRAVILQHELSHARFATDTVYQNFSVWFWSNALSLVQRDRFTRFLRSRGYDTSIRELCANEMQAFLMNTPDPAMFSASDIGVTEPELGELRRRFSDGIAGRPRAMAEKPYQFD